MTDHRFTVTRFQIRKARTPDGIMRVEGYAATFQAPENHNDHGEIIRPGAFLETIEQVKAGSLRVKMLSNHNSAVGVWDDIREDDVGLRVAGDIINTKPGREAAKMVRSGVFDGLSVGFDPNRTQMRQTKTMSRFGYPVVEITQMCLREVSLTPFPSDEFTSVHEVRSRRRRAWQRRQKPTATRGAALSALLEGAIAEIESEDMPRAEIVDMLASALDLDESTVNQIIRGDIDCLVDGQAEVIASVLDLTQSAVLDALEVDGCLSSEDDDAERSDDTPEATRGAILAGKLAEAIDAMLEGMPEMDEGALIDALAEAAEADPSDVMMILAGEMCPTLAHLEGFASVLGVDMMWLREGAEEDGCIFEDGEMPSDMAADMPDDRAGCACACGGNRDALDALKRRVGLLEFQMKTFRARSSRRALPATTKGASDDEARELVALAREMNRRAAALTLEIRSSKDD